VNSISQWLGQHRTALILIALIGLVFLAFRTRSSGLRFDELQAAIGSGQPSIIEFYSNT